MKTLIKQKKSKLLLYLNRQKLIFAGTNLPNPITLDFPANAVKDIEITDTDYFSSILINFLKLNDLPPSEALLILSPDIYYQKSLNLSVDPNEKQKQIENFTENIPFKNLYVKDYYIKNQNYLIAINKKFYEPILRSLKDNGFIITSIIPGFILDLFQIKLTNYLPKEVKDVYSQNKYFKDYSLVPVLDIQKISTIQIVKSKEDKTKTIILVVVFIILLLVFISLKLFLPKLFKSSKPPTAQKIIATPTVQVVPSFTPTPTINYLKSEDLKIKIINSSGVSNQAAKIKQFLTQLEYKQIATASTPVITANKNQISFSPDVSPESKQKIIQKVEELIGSVIEVDSSELSTYNIIITIVSKTFNKPTP